MKVVTTIMSRVRHGLEAFWMFSVGFPTEIMSEKRYSVTVPSAFFRWGDENCSRSLYLAAGGDIMPMRVS